MSNSIGMLLVTFLKGGGALHRKSYLVYILSGTNGTLGIPGECILH